MSTTSDPLYSERQVMYYLHSNLLVKSHYCSSWSFWWLGIRPPQVDTPDSIEFHKISPTHRMLGGGIDCRAPFSKTKNARSSPQGQAQARRVRQDQPTCPTPRFAQSVRQRDRPSDHDSEVRGDIRRIRHDGEARVREEPSQDRRDHSTC